jgi:hypothetical protein
MEENSMGERVACGGYVKVQSAPHTYDQGAEAEGEDAKCAPLRRFCLPRERRIAGGSRIACRVLHLLYKISNGLHIAKENTTNREGVYKPTTLDSEQQRFIQAPRMLNKC